MSNGYEMINQMDFEERLKGMDNRELMEFTARQVYSQGNQLAKLPCRQGDCTSGFSSMSIKKATGISTLVIGALVAVIYGLLKLIEK